MRRVLICPFGGANLLLSLARLLEESFPEKYDFTYLSFTEYGRHLYRQVKGSHVHIEPGALGGYLPEEMLEEVIVFSMRLAERQFGDPLRSYLQRAANHYSAEIDRVLERLGIDEVVEFNGRMNLFISALDAAADRRGLPKLVFEQGLFRPDYLTVDGRGVNCRNSIDSLDSLLSGLPLPYQERALYRDLKSLFPLPKDAISDFKRKVPKLPLLAAYVKMKAQPRRRIFLRTAEGRDLLEAGLFKGRAAPRTDILDRLLDSDEYRKVILCPFQVETDTQMLLHSPWIRDMKQLVEAVAGSVSEYNRRRRDKVLVVFKLHPMHQFRMDLGNPEAVLVNEFTVPQILRRRCDLVITVNSTAGIEAIEEGAPVITLGQAFYAFPGVISGHCSRPEEMPTLIDRALNEQTMDRNLQRRFIEALKTRYQVRLR